MHFQFTFKQMDSSPALQSYAEAKLLEKIEKFVTKPIEAHVVFSVIRHQQTAHLHLKAGDGFGLEVEHTCEDMYASVDQLADKLGAQLKKHKDRLKDHRAPRTAERVDQVLGEGETLTATAAASEPLVDAGDIVKYENARKRH